MYTFYENSLVTDFISNLLYRYWLPTYDTVAVGDYIHKDIIYIYQTSIIKCTKSGYIGGKYTQTSDLYNHTFAEFFTEQAEYEKLLDYHIGDRFRRFTDNYINTDPIYSSGLHERLGKFVRAYSDLTGTDLRPYYNYNSNRFFKTLYIGKSFSATEASQVSYQLYNTAVQKYTTYIIPIKFNRTYTIALDCKSQVLICPIFLSKLRRLQLSLDDGEKQDISDDFLEKTNDFFVYPNMSFTQPKHIKIDCTYDLADEFYKYRNDLYLFIQLPLGCTSSVTVLEGKYTNMPTGTLVCNEPLLDNASKETLNKMYISKLSLLMLNTNSQVPFSNRLIEYLFDNVIDYTWKLDTNIEKAQQLLTNNISSQLISGIWSNRMRVKCFNFSNENPRGFKFDLSGNIDRETERLLLKSIRNEEDTF